MLKRVYLFLRRHVVGVARTMYLLPFLTLFIRDKWFRDMILYFCMFLCLILELGNSKKWREDYEQ